MARCIRCNSETELSENDLPKCAECRQTKETPPRPAASEQQIRELLLREVFETTARTNAAAEEFNALMDAIPSGIPYPDGTDRIHQASRELSAARKQMMSAHSRLNDFLGRGKIPEDIKFTGEEEKW